MISGLHNIYLMNIFFLWYFCEYFCVLGIALGFQNSQYHIDTTAPVCLVSSVFSYPFLFFSMPLLAYSFIFSLFCFFLCGCIECVCTFCVWGQMRVYLHKSSFTLFISFLYMWVNSCVCACMCSWKQAHVYHSASLEIRGQPQVLLVTFHIVWVMVSFFCVLFITVLPD